MLKKMENGFIVGVKTVLSPYFNDRPADCQPTLLVIHNISLPPGKYGGPYVDQLFTGKLDPQADAYFATIHQLEVSSHLFIRRDGEVIQFVSCDKRAWHAGKSSYQGVENCNDFSIGIELEGCDHEPFTEVQYQVLAEVTQLLKRHYPINDIVGHSNIAPGRKTDPGDCFDWTYYQGLLQCLSTDVFTAASTTLSSRISQQLYAIEAAMQRCGLWQMQPPALQAFESQQPFCLDTMSGEAWLQWIFLPRMRAIIDAGAELPSNFSLYPYFEEVFKSTPDSAVNSGELLVLIKQLDEMVKTKPQ